MAVADIEVKAQTQRLTGKLNQTCSCRREDGIGGGSGLSGRVRTLAGTDGTKEDRKFPIQTVRASIDSWGRRTVGIYHQHISRAASVVSRETHPPAFMNDLVQSHISPFKAKEIEIQIWLYFFLFFFVCLLVSPIFPPFLRMSKAPYDATIAYFSLHGPPIASHLVSRALLNQAIVEQNALFKMVFPSKTENVLTQYKMKPISYPFSFCHQAFPVAVKCSGVVIVLLSCTSAVS